MTNINLNLASNVRLASNANTAQPAQQAQAVSSTPVMANLASSLPTAGQSQGAGAVAFCLPPNNNNNPRINVGGIRVVNLPEADGTPDNKSQVSIPYTGNINIKDASKISITARMTEPVNKSVNIPILSVTKDPKNPNQLIIKTGQQVPKGATIRIQTGALATNGGANIPGVTVGSPQGISQTDFNMTNRAFKPTNINLFTRTAFPNATTAPVPAAGNYTEQQALNEVTNLYNKAVAAKKMTPTERTQRLNQFKSPQAKAIMPDPKLRAGLFSLAGTSASAAIDSVLTSNNQSGKQYASISYDSTLSEGAMISQGISDGSRIIKVSPAFKGEPIEAIGANFAHEVMHQDNVNGQQEEVLSETARAMVWSEQLIINPSLANKNTLAVRTNNTLSLALLNSGNNGYPKVGITSAPQIQTGATTPKSKVFVGGNENYISLDNYARTFAASAGLQDVNTAGNSYLTSFVSKVNKSNVSNNGFSRETRDGIDKNQLALSNTDALNLSNILRLSA
jgi:hypothetical protein